jgi:alcohol dehydrogenase YqhD (iron-dependent ADH family)
LRTLIENFSVVLDNPKNYEARANIMLSATMALNGLIGMGVNQDWATHMIEHEISAFYDIPHGAGLAIITPRWMKTVLTQKKVKLTHYGRRIWGLDGDNEIVSQTAIEKTYDFFASMGIRMSLTEWDIDDTHFPAMIERLVKKRIGEKPLTENQIEEILRSCCS